ncbi:MAG: phosphate ABC transporter permease subunit PstC [Chloroflexia bacterium]|nr:phosphate ABC transporter permease subunit PstC [Chloroflexia bacterium]
MRRGSYRAVRERVIYGLLFACAFISVMTTFGIVWVLLGESIGFFREVSLVEFFTGTRWTPLFASQSFGLLPLLNASVLIAAIALLVAIPFGLGSAIYLAEYAPRRVREVLKPTLEILAGIPTVVYGYFALLFITPLLRSFIPGVQVFNALAAGIAMGIMIIPMVASLSEDAISSVPRSLRDAASAVGATDMEKVIGVTVPAALSGIVASFILAMSRAVGETMIVSIAAGNAPELLFNPLQGMQTMTAYIVQVSLGDTPRGTIEYSTIFAVGATLFVMTLILNILSRMVVQRFREVYD